MKQLLWNSAVMVLSAMLAIGCDGGKKDPADKDGKKKQVITQKGSDTMVLLAQKWAEEFHKKNPEVDIQVSGGGSGTGIAALINGGTDIANSSRPMKSEEKEKIKQKSGVDVVEIPVAKDGIAIYVNAANPIEKLSVEQLRDIYSGKVTNWKDLGGSNAKIVLYGRENSSGTYEYFKEHVLNKGDFTPSTQTLQGTAAIVSAINGDKNGIGYGGEAYTTKEIKQVKLINDKGEAIAPTQENVLSGAYPLSRELYFYLSKPPAGATKDFIDWALSNDGQKLVKEMGYFPLKAL